MAVSREKNEIEKDNNNKKKSQLEDTRGFIISLETSFPNSFDAKTCHRVGHAPVRTDPGD